MREEKPDSQAIEQYKTKEARLILQSGIYVYIYIFTNISVGTAFLLQGLSHNEEVKLGCFNLK